MNRRTAKKVKELLRNRNELVWIVVRRQEQERGGNILRGGLPGHREESDKGFRLTDEPGCYVPHILRSTYRSSCASRASAMQRVGSELCHMTCSVQLSRSKSMSYQAAGRTSPTRHVLLRVIYRSFEEDSQEGASRRSFEQDSQAACMRRPSKNSSATILEQDQEVTVAEPDASRAPSLEAIIGMRTAVIMRLRGKGDGRTRVQVGASQAAGPATHVQTSLFLCDPTGCMLPPQLDLLLPT
jgi:hypothetical protein